MRSAYIYVVVDPDRKAPVAAFTVMYEMKNWLDRQPAWNRKVYELYRVRCREQYVMRITL